MGRRRRPARNPAPVAGEGLGPGPGQAARRLADLGPDGRVGAELDRRVNAALPGLVSLSALTSALAVEYVERVARPVAALSPPAGVRLVARGYVAHLVVEDDPSALSVSDIPVLGNLPPPDRKGRLPRDLLTRVVKATRRQFPVICALSPAAWEGFVVASAASEGDPALGTAVVDGLMRTGWVLRQVDLAYGGQPERT